VRLRARRLGAIGAVSAFVALWPATSATAHPLGNFTVNVYGGVVVQPDAIVVDYVVDMAEIPAFRELREIDRNLDERVDEEESLAYRDATCEALADGLRVSVDGAAVPLDPTGEHALEFPAGAGGLTTLRLGCRLQGAIDTIGGDVALTYADRNYPDALGWREVTAVGDRTTLASSNVPQASVSDRLTDYSASDLPLDVRRAEAVVTPGGPALASIPGPEVGAQASSAIGNRDGGVLASLIGREEITPALVAAMVAIAFGIGAVHALGPGHGKTLIAGYLVGAGGGVRQAVGIGIAVSVMHTASVLTLGVLVLSAERLFAPERVYPVLGLASGAIAVVLGTWLLVGRTRAIARGKDPGHRHPHGHDSGHTHPHGHDHPDPRIADAPLSRRGSFALAFSGGVLPSPSALLVLLASVSLGRTALGLTLIAAFSVGLAGALIGVGIVTLKARDIAERRLTSGIARFLPVASAAGIAAMGLFLAVRGATQL
jgi:ABC-type nickel/cobalt efflux system permease component RcnA